MLGWPFVDFNFFFSIYGSGRFGITCMVTSSATGEGLNWLRTGIPSPRHCIAVVYIALSRKTLAINQSIFKTSFRVFACV